MNNHMYGALAPQVGSKRVSGSDFGKPENAATIRDLWRHADRRMAGAIISSPGPAKAGRSLLLRMVFDSDAG